jgi:hypothetical protein
MGAAVLTAAAAVAAAEPGDTAYEKVVVDMLKQVDEITTVLGSVTNPDTAAAAKPKLKSAAEELLKLRKQAAEMDQPGKEEKDRLAKAYAPKFEAAMKKLEKESQRVRGVRGGDEALAELAILKDKKDKKDGK